MSIIDPLRSPKYSRSEFEPNPYALIYQKGLIKRQTSAEKRFAEILSNLKIENIFQHPLNIGCSDFYILDFYLPHLNLGFEIDGPSHYKKDGLLKDRIREKRIWEFHGIKIYRWSNKRVLEKSREIVKFMNKYILPIRSR
jgi:very-short-patch-repair endonuclease